MEITLGTIVMMARRPGYVVLGADRMSSTGDDPASPIRRDFDCKIVAHPTLPVAVATAGLKLLPEWDPDGRVAETPTRAVVAEFLASIGSGLEVDLPRFMRYSESRLLPVVREVRRRFVGRPKGPMVHVDLFVAASVAGTPTSFHVRIGDDVTSHVDAEILTKPASLDEFFRYVADYGALRGEADPTAERASRAVRDVIREAVDFERALHGENRECGGDPDVVVVDAGGVRWTTGTDAS